MTSKSRTFRQTLVGGVVAIVAAPRADTPEGTEFLRLLVALRACGRSVSLHEVGPGVGALSGEAAPTVDGSRYLDALATEGVVPRSGEDLLETIATTESVMVLADPARTGTPAFLRLRRGERPTEEDLHAIQEAGQVALG